MAESIRVNADLFRAAYECVSTEETRYYLNGVFVEPHEKGGAVLVSTDGHRLVAIWDPVAVATRPAIIALPKQALQACKSKRIEQRFVVVDLDDPSKTAHVVSASSIGGDESPIAVAVKSEIDGSFPDYRRVIPEPSKDNVRASFNPAYLSSMCRVGEIVARADGDGSPPAMTIIASSEGSPAIVRWSGIHNAFGILMPVRSEHMDGLPHFFQPPQQKQAA